MSICMIISECEHETTLKLKNFLLMFFLKFTYKLYLYIATCITLEKSEI